MDGNLQNLTDTLQKFARDQVFFTEVTRELIRFFEELLIKAEKSSLEQKEEFTSQAIEMLHQLVALINPSIEGMAVSEESLISALDHPQYFDADEWNSAKDAKEQIGELARKLLFYLAITPDLKNSPDSLKKDKKQPPRATKSQWMKS